MEIFITERQFWAGVAILIRNYHAINRKIFACIIHKVLRVNKGIENFCEKDNYRNLEDDVIYETTEADLDSVLDKMGKLDSCNDAGEGFIILVKFLTKKFHQNIEAAGKIDFVNKMYTCKFLDEVLDGFSIKFVEGKISVGTVSKRTTPDKSKRWTDFVLKPKLIKWCTNPSVNALNVAETPKRMHSLQLVDLEDYNELYKMLKSKYAQKALNCWNEAKESTDPMKFIYEDLAIAAYLICLWQRVGSPNGFADLGCGNGLLVYLLSEEGFSGYGYDVRRRKIWSYYPKSIRLFEKTIEPYEFKLPEEVDWVIGNHSDELSPWLPVLAATTGYQMRYFLLPCCAYELSGAKFQRRNASTSIYQDFYAYLHIISQNCGFVTLKDRLKIPSTKRLALLGIERTYMIKHNEKNIEEVERFVREEQKKYGNGISDSNVKLRDRYEAVRNCTQIDKNKLDPLILKIFHQLMIVPNKTFGENNDGSSWQTGNRLRMCEIIQNLGRSDLQIIKAECGGIKTLLRNKHEIFEFLGEDFVGIRKPSIHAEKAKIMPHTVKKRPCFFHLHHPDGCPLLSEQCTFIH